MSEREPRPNDTPLDTAVCNYTLVLDKLHREGEEGYEGRLIHAIAALDAILDSSAPHFDGRQRYEVRDALITSPTNTRFDQLSFEDRLTVLRLVPLRTIVSDYVPLELVTPETVTLSFNAVMQGGNEIHTACINGSYTEQGCDTRQLCPAKTTRLLGNYFLEILTMHLCFGSTNGTEINQTQANIDAVEERMVRLQLMSEKEVEKLTGQHYDGFVREYGRFVASITEEETNDSDG
jgi:hypothetical protein